MILHEHFTLADGNEIPKLGFGTWRIDDDRVAESARNAIEIGYRHIDTAQAYANELGIGEAISNSGIAREDLFITTKVKAEFKRFDDALKSIDQSLEVAGLDYFDLIIIHSPQPWDQFRNGNHFFEGNLEAWRALERAQQEGKVRSIGVSNFEQVDIENIISNGTVRPVVNQVLAHIGNTPFDLIDYCKEEDILVEAYSPVAHGKLLSNADVGAMAERYDATIAQLCIRYCLELGLLPLPKAVTPAHIRENSNVDFSISADDMETLKRFDAVNYGEASRFPVFSGKLG